MSDPAPQQAACIVCGTATPHTVTLNQRAYPACEIHATGIMGFTQQASALVTGALAAVGLAPHEQQAIWEFGKAGMQLARMLLAKEPRRADSAESAAVDPRESGQ